MGRNKKYHTEKELKEANNAKSRRYYVRNKLKIDQKQKDRYHENKDKTE